MSKTIESFSENAIPFRILTTGTNHAPQEEHDEIIFGRQTDFEIAAQKKIYPTVQDCFQQTGEALMKAALPFLDQIGYTGDFVLPQSIGAEQYHDIETEAHNKIRGLIRQELRSYAQRIGLPYEDHDPAKHAALQAKLNEQTQIILSGYWNSARDAYMKRMERANIPSKRQDLSLAVENSKAGTVELLTITYRIENYRRKDPGAHLASLPSPQYVM